MLNHIHQTFASHGLRCTRQRVAIYVSLCARGKHPTADDLFRNVTTHDPGLSLATVYNTLEAFCRAGIAHKLPGVGGNGSARYDAASDNHLHLRCEHTGNVADVPNRVGQKILDRISPDVLEEVESELGFKINQVQVELVGKYK